MKNFRRQEVITVLAALAFMAFCAYVVITQRHEIFEEFKRDYGCVPGPLLHDPVGRPYHELHCKDIKYPVGPIYEPFKEPEK